MPRRKLITKKIEKELEKAPFGSKDGMGDAAPIVAKFFTPRSNWTWYVLEGERDGDDWRLYGLVDGFEREYGYFMLSELSELFIRGVPAVERDLHFEGKKIGDV